ncbi:hypothetical protein JCM8097_000847 [Rhodosporidiobolus ruineniae]
MASSADSPARPAVEMRCAQCKKMVKELELVNMNRCTACKVVHYCTPDCQKTNWKIHKPACVASASSKPYILHIDFNRATSDDAPWCKPLLDSMTIPHSRTYALATSPSQASAILDHPIPPAAILCTSGEIVDDKCADIRTKLRICVENGARLVLGGPIANFLHLGRLDSAFTDFGASWKYMGYHRTTHSLNVAHPLYASLPGHSPARGALPSSYSCKSVFLKDVPADEAVYLTDRNAQYEGLVPMPGAEVTTGEVAVAAKKVGEGWFAWVGDVNQEQGSTTATLFLLGLKQ